MNAHTVPGTTSYDHPQFKTPRTGRHYFCWRFLSVIVLGCCCFILTELWFIRLLIHWHFRFYGYDDMCLPDFINRFQHVSKPLIHCPLGDVTFRNIFSYHMLQIKLISESYESALRWMTFDNKSILFQVMVWFRQATSHYLSQCWPTSMSPYGGTRAWRVEYVMSILMSLVLYTLYVSARGLLQYNVLMLWNWATYDSVSSFLSLETHLC